MYTIHIYIEIFFEGLRNDFTDKVKRNSGPFIVKVMKMTE